MNELVLNDTTVAKMIADHEAEMAALKALATKADAEEYLKNLDNFEISKFLPEGTRAGEIRRAKKNGESLAYGFISDNYGDVFVPPSTMEEFSDGERVAYVSKDGPRGPVVERVAGLSDFISWHHQEVIDRIITHINKERADKIEWYGNMVPSHGWEEMKTKCRELLGITLIEVKKFTKTENYGGHGVDTYTFAEPVTHEQAGKVLDVLGARHAEPDNGCPYDHGHDNICITPALVGFENSWCGPWCD